MNTQQSDELYHHGIKGQKWGVRRYYNEDGTMTKAGRKRYGADLDINDKSRVNIARIRKGEAYRRLDKARANNGTNYTRIADLQRRVRSAKAAEKNMKIADKGAKLKAKGQTIGGNAKRTTIAVTSAVLASKGFNKFLNARLSDLGSQGRLTPGHISVAKSLDKIGSSTAQSLAIAYGVKKFADNNKIRRYNNASLTGMTSVKNVGSVEYADVVKRRKNN